MKKHVLLFLALLMAAALFSQPWDGPFGLKMGLTYSQLKAIDPGIKREADYDDMYLITKVPRPHRDFEYYYVFISPKYGLYKISGFTKGIYCSPSGWELKSQFLEYETMLREIYGNCKKFDFLDYGSIWNKPNDFMMGILLKERRLSCYWTKDYGSSMKNSIYIIELQAGAYNVTTGWIMLKYEFNNAEQAYNEQKAKKKAAF